MQTFRPPIIDRLSKALGVALNQPPSITDEADFQRRLVDILGKCDVEVPMSFDAPANPALKPTSKAIAECAAKGRRLDPEGVDPCSGKHRSLDVLWHVDDLHVPVELKLVTSRKSDVYGYQFLKDLHRLERLSTAGGIANLAETRFAVFATSIPAYWTDGPPEPVVFRLFDSRCTPKGMWIQYDQPSERTRWLDYPPFHLANSYEFRWRNVEPFGRVLIVPVDRQRT